MTSERVLVTGASGYSAAHVVKLLQEKGYQVRGTVRRLQDEKKVAHLYSLCSGARHPLELVEADLTVDDSWLPAVKDMDYVIHMAGPFPSVEPEDEAEVLNPTVQGTLSVLHACAQTRTVKRVVLTSSVFAVNECTKSSDVAFTEDHWTDVAKAGVVAKSKTLAEQAAWDFVRKLPEDKKFELVVINPALVLGPPLHGSLCTGIEILQRLMERRIPMIVKLYFVIADVRDVALAHVTALTSSEACGRRHICCNGGMWMSEMAHLLKLVFESQGYNIPSMIMPRYLLHAASVFDSGLRPLLPQVGVFYKFDNNRMVEVLKVAPRNVRDTVIDMAYALVESGFVKKTSKYRGPRGAMEREAYLNVPL